MHLERQEFEGGQSIQLVFLHHALYSLRDMKWPYLAFLNGMGKVSWLSSVVFTLWVVSALFEFWVFCSDPFAVSQHCPTPMSIAAAVQ